MGALKKLFESLGKTSPFQSKAFFPLTHNHLTQTSWQHIEKSETLAFFRENGLHFIIPGLLLLGKLSPYQLDPSTTPDPYQLTQERVSSLVQGSKEGKLIA